METYKTSRERFRQQDAIAASLRRSLKGVKKAERQAAIERAATIPLTDKQRGKGRGA